MITEEQILLPNRFPLTMTVFREAFDKNVMVYNPLKSTCDESLVHLILSVSEVEILYVGFDVSIKFNREDYLGHVFIARNYKLDLECEYDKLFKENGSFPNSAYEHVIIGIGNTGPILGAC